MLGIFLDTETNGLNPFKHKTIEIALKLINLLSGEEIAQFEGVVRLSEAQWALSDKESLKVNGFTWDEVSQGTSPEVVGSAIERLFAKSGVQRGRAVFICQNPSFDRVFFSQLVSPDTQEALLWPYHWLDLASMYWALSMHKHTPAPHRWPWETGTSKDNIAALYRLPKEHHPHKAMNGVNHLILCYQTIVGFPQCLGGL